MKTEQLIPLCRRHHALLLHSDEQTISIAVVDTPPTELMEALRFATQKRIDIECWSQEQMDKRLQVQEKQALLENQPLLENAGLDVADFGGSTVLLRAVPADVEPQNAEDLLVEIADRLLGRDGRMVAAIDAIALFSPLAEPKACFLPVVVSNRGRCG